GVAIISVTVVPALVPTFLKGRLRGEEENAIVRSFIHIYKPLLTWALPRRNLVMWFFSAMLILAAGIFPLQSLVGMGATQMLPQHRSGGILKHVEYFFGDLMDFLTGRAPSE